MDAYEFFRKISVKFRMAAMFPVWKLMFRKFGRRSYLGPRSTFINPKSVSIGRNSWIWGNSRIEAVRRHGEDKFDPIIEIGDGVSIQQNFHCTCALSVRIGSGTAITPNCGIFDIDHPYEEISTSPQHQRYSIQPVEIGEDCLIGMNSVIMPGTKLGKHCVVGANSTVRGTFPSLPVRRRS